MDAQENLARQFSALPKEWQIWLEENLERGCRPTDLVNILLREGLIDLDQNFAAQVQLEPQHDHQQEQTALEKQAQLSITFNQQQQKWLAQAVLNGTD